ncbi:response regulator [uncultured Sulfitobacter sp.]|uniref:response regulator n=1 Tax=uncultured Sulfitobacter sp. TaxID=191468 RepID=UPI00260DB131|nr:response regulator [uncultured Sulfitobacter sp.]
MSRLSPIRPNATHPPPMPGSARILIVEDQRFDRMRLKRLCTALEFNTHIAEADTLSAMLDHLNKDRFDLVLLDHNLPDGTGLQGVEMIRANPANRHAATIMITGVEDMEIAVRALKNGFSDYMTKDELSAASLRRAAINALQKSTLSAGLENQGALRAELQKCLSRFSRECAQEIKPVVSRMLRQMRELRDFDRLTPEQAATKFDRMELSCQRLWEFLDDLDSYTASDLAIDQSSPMPIPGNESATPDENEPVSPGQERSRHPAKGKRPPLVFSRRPD